MRIRSIKFKILISFSILIVAIITFTAFEAVQTGGKLLGDSSKDTVQTLAGDNAKLVESRMETPIKELTIIATQEDIIDMNLSNQLVLLKNQLPNTSFLALAVVTKNGTAYYNDGSTAELGDRDYIKKALGGEANISDVVISKATGQPVIMVAVPIKKGNEVVGALIGRKDGNTLSEIATDAGFGKEGFAFMINSSGQIIAHENSDKVTGEINPITDKDSTYKSLATAEKYMLEKGTGFTTYKENGKVIYAGFTTVKGTDWTIIVTATEKEAIAAVKTLRDKIFFIVVISLIITIILAFFLGDAVTKSIKAITKLSERIANLDITENVPEKFLKMKDENGILARAMQSIMESLRNIVGEITDSSSQVSSTAEELTATCEQSSQAADEVSKTVEEIAKGATEQASNTESGSSKAINLGNLIDKNREQVYNMNKTSDKVTEVVNGGLVDIQRLNAISEENNTATKEIYDIILKMNQSTAQIGEASNVIAAIAEQTNLLSLNASIEAARAGEAGKGFAVVASEIKKLAGQSAISTSYINGIVNDLQSVVTKAVESIERVNEISKEQFDSVINTRQKYESIMKAMEETEEAINNLNSSEGEMTQAKNDIMDMLQTLSAIAEENAASTEEASSSILEQSASIEEIAKSSETLAQLANSLQEIIMKFKV